MSEALTALRGTWFVVPTAFAEDGSLDLESQRRLAGAAVGWGVDGLTLMGVTSETSALSADERTRALEAIFDAVGGRVPIVVGCSGASIAAATAFVEQAGALGAIAAMVAAPPFLKNADLLPAFFGSVAKKGGLPLVVQDEPAATGVTIPVSVLLKCLEVSGARVVKLEDPPTPPKIARLLAAGPGLQVFGGLGGAWALSEFRRGACGTMTGFAFPEILSAVRRAWESGNREHAGRLFDRFLPLIQFEAQPVIGLAIRKELLRRRGVLATALTRSIVSVIDAVTSEELYELLGRVGVVASPEPLEVG